MILTSSVARNLLHATFIIAIFFSRGLFIQSTILTTRQRKLAFMINTEDLNEKSDNCVRLKRDLLQKKDGIKFDLVEELVIKFESVISELSARFPGLDYYVYLNDAYCGFYHAPDKLKTLIILKQVSYKLHEELKPTKFKGAQKENFSKAIDKIKSLWYHENHFVDKTIGFPISEIRFSQAGVNLFQRDCFNNNGVLVVSRQEIDKCAELGGTIRSYLHNMFYMYLFAQKSILAQTTLKHSVNSCEDNFGVLGNDAALDSWFDFVKYPSIKVFCMKATNNLVENCWTLDNRRLAMAAYVQKKLEKMFLSRLDTNCNLQPLGIRGTSNLKLKAKIQVTMISCAYDSNNFPIEADKDFFDCMSKNLVDLHAKIAPAEETLRRFAPAYVVENPDIFNIFLKGNQETHKEPGQCAIVEDLLVNNRVNRAIPPIIELNFHELNLFCNSQPPQFRDECRYFYADIKENFGRICTF